MKNYGIYTLANDAVFDQLVALLNSIEVNVSADMPVCIIPFDQNISQISHLVTQRSNLTLFQNEASLARWDKFVTTVWAAHPQSKRKAKKAHWTLGHNRKFVAFDGEFDKFVFYDADSLAMQPLDKLFQKLEHYDFVFDDWEHNKPRKSAALNLDLIERTSAFREGDVRPSLHCSSFFGSKQGRFNSEKLYELQRRLIENQEIRWVPRWWDDAFLFNYLTFRSNYSLFNFTLSSDYQDRTGNCAGVDDFIEINKVLYNLDGSKPIHRLHYMGYSNRSFSDLSQGEDVDIAHKDVFLHYRFLKEREKQPTTLHSPSFSKKVVKFLDSVKGSLAVSTKLLNRKTS